MIFCLYLISGNAHSASETYEEYAIKTAFLYRALHYIDWDTLASNSNTIVICVIDSDAFSKTITSLDKRSVNERVISIQKIPSVDKTIGCNVLHLSATTPKQVKSMLAKLNHVHVLTISDHKHFAESGVILNFPIENQKVIIEINIDAANEKNIRFSAKLLRIANIVGN